MIPISDIRVNTIIYSYANDFTDVLPKCNATKIIGGVLEYSTSNDILVFEGGAVKKYFPQLCEFLKELTDITSIHNNETVIFKDFHILTHLQQNCLKSFFTRRVFILLTNKYSIIHRNILSYCVLIRIKEKEFSHKNKEILTTSLHHSFKINDIDSKKEVAYILHQSGVDISKFFADFVCLITENEKIPVSVKIKVMWICEKYERYYHKSYKDLVVIEGLIIKLSYELKEYIHCL
jgi:hypothetical protein|tara:strand:+ start:2981 stop:3685 length:705 start_codon:yes stop_codon:yes gene_type:complete